MTETAFVTRLAPEDESEVPIMSDDIYLLPEELLPASDVQHLLNTEEGRPEDELGEMLEHFDFEFDEAFEAEEADEWDRPDDIQLEDEAELYST